ncbi:MAG: GNAT family N-acetyltransferase [Chloroflexota bacterium]|nr:GNAT family N-acetyltransferase [Chloroflexota bacterium]
MHDAVEVRRITASEWRELRSLRLEALQDSPRSYGSTYAREATVSDGEWQERAAEGAKGRVSVAVAALADGRWVGMARGYLEPPSAHLVAVYVTPGWRRRGVGQAVSQAVVAWARQRGAREILLSVSDWNQGARSVYEALGFVANGVQRSLPWDASITESEMRLGLTD